MIYPDLDSQFHPLKMTEKTKKVIIEYLESHYEEVEEKFLGIIIQQIESWYLAGFNEAFVLPFISNTETVTKGTLEKIARNKSFKTNEEQLKKNLCTIHRSNYSIEEAKQRNHSFRKFWEKLETLFAKNK